MDRPIVRVGEMVHAGRVVRRRPAKIGWSDSKWRFNGGAVAVL